MSTVLGRLVGVFAGAALVLGIWSAESARADWTTYRGDAARSGVDSSSVGSLPFAAAWQSPGLGGDIWGQPLVYHGLVIAATEGNTVVALNESTGQVVWGASTGKPVPNSELACSGDIAPTVGITSTPVIDPATNRLFVVADTWDGTNATSIVHKLFAFDVLNGSPVAGFPVNVDPSGDDPPAQLQRAALALDGGEVVIGYGGNDGDCGPYHGWLVGVSETGVVQQPPFEVDQAGTEGAIWGAGDGPAIDASGNVWAATGNSTPGSTYGFQDSVLKLNPALTLVDHWAPSNWPDLDTSDLDLGSSDPLLLPGGLVFQIGKEGVGYLLSASSLNGTGANPVYQAQVCGGGSGSFGGAIYFGGVIYVTCSDGLRALTLNTTTPSFAPLSSWHVTSAAIGPPIVSGGLVWVTDWNNATLYGLNLQTGQAVVTQPTPSMEHFASPSASNGKLFLATGTTVEAYTIANPAPTPAPPSAGTAPPPPAAPAFTCTLRLRSARVKLQPRRRPRHRKHLPPRTGTVTVIAKCTQNATVTLRATVTERLRKKTRHRKARTKRRHLTAVHATVRAGASKTLVVRIPASLLSALERRVHESAVFTVTARNGNRTTTAVVRATLKRP